MDKLRAIQYFIAAAEEHSLSAAARKYEVSVPAVAKLITSLERTLGVNLFNRNVQGSTLTADGERYLETCKPLLDQLAEADEVLRNSAADARGTLVVGAPQMLAQHVLVPALPRFHARYPDLQIDIRDVNAATTTIATAPDVFILFGWGEPPGDVVRKHIGESRFQICASPGYWSANGVPQSPKDLEKHVCLLFRTPAGAVHDLWQLERNGIKESVAARGWLISSHRDVVLAAALAGAGVVRLTDLTIRAHVQSGRLVPVLLDWVMRDSPPIELLYRPTLRRIPRVRLFIDFVIDVFRELDAEREERVGGKLRVERPRWWARRGLASTAVLE